MKSRGLFVVHLTVTVLLHLRLPVGVVRGMHCTVPCRLQQLLSSQYSNLLLLGYWLQILHLGPQFPPEAYYTAIRDMMN